MTHKITVLIVDDLPDTRLNIEKLLGFEPDIEVVGHAAGGEEAIQQAQRLKPHVILMDINMDGLDGISATRAITQSVPEAQIIIMSVQSDADYFRRAMLSGARDFLMKPFSADELFSAVRSVYESRPKPVQPEPVYKNGATPHNNAQAANGKLIAVYSPKGGTGATTVAINLGVFLAKQQHRTLLIDGNFQFGDVAVMLNLKSSTTILDLLDRTEDLDIDLVNSVAATHKTGLRVLTAPVRPEMAELVTPSRLTQLLDFLLGQYDFIVVDADSSLTEATLAVMDKAERVVLVTQPSLASLKNASLFLDLVRGLGYSHERVSLVVNRSSSSQRLSLGDIEGVLKQKALISIPDDDQYAAHAADQGFPLVYGPAQKRPVAAALRDLGAQLLQSWHSVAEVEQESSSPIRLGRLFGGR